MLVVHTHKHTHMAVASLPGLVVPHFLNVVLEGAVEGAQVGRGERVERHAPVLRHLHRRSGDVVRLPERHALISVLMMLSVLAAGWGAWWRFVVMAAGAVVQIPVSHAINVKLQTQKRGSECSVETQNAAQSTGSATQFSPSLGRRP